MIMNKESFQENLSLDLAFYVFTVTLTQKKHDKMLESLLNLVNEWWQEEWTTQSKILQNNIQMKDFEVLWISL